MSNSFASESLTLDGFQRVDLYHNEEMGVGFGKIKHISFSSSFLSSM